MKKFLLTSLVGILAVSTANAFDVAPYASIKGGYSVNNLAVKGDSLNFDSGFYEDELLAAIASTAKTIADPLDVRIHTNGVWSVNPAVGMKFCFDDVKFAKFRLEAEFALNQKAKKEISLVGEDSREDISVKMKNFGIMANAYMDFETNSFIKPFITAGLGWGRSKFNVDAILDGESFFGINEIPNSWKDNNLIWSVGGGLTFDVTENIAIDAQYRYMNYGNVTVEIPDLGSVDVKDVMHQFMLGARYAF